VLCHLRASRRASPWATAPRGARPASTDDHELLDGFAGPCGRGVQLRKGSNRAAGSPCSAGVILPGQSARFAYWVKAISAAAAAAPAVSGRVSGCWLAGRPGDEVEET
jgi:hypothetical protein